MDEDEIREQNEIDRDEYIRENHPMYQDPPTPPPIFGEDY